jgi:hypothetical protein
MKWFCALLLLCGLLVPQHLLAARVALFDEGHGQAFLVGGERPLDLSSLAGVFRTAGYEVRSTTQAFTAEQLADVDVLVISGAFQPLSAAELQAVREFVVRGGGLAVMLHIAPPVGPLLHALEVDFTNGTLREHNNLIRENPQNFRVLDLVPHPLTAGVPDFAIYGAWALRGTAPGIDVVARTTAHGWVDLNHDGRLDAGDAVQPFGVVVAGTVGHGRIAVFGDDAIFQNRFLEGNNRLLAENLARWLPAEPHP